MEICAYTSVGRHSTSSPARLFLRPKKRTSRVGSLRFLLYSKQNTIDSPFRGLRKGILHILCYMTKEETLLHSWKNSLGEESVFSNDYSVDGNIAILTVTRCINEYDTGRGLYVKCRFQVDDINRAIDFLSNNRDCLI